MPASSPRSPRRRLALLFAASLAVLLSCGRELTGPIANAVRTASGLSFSTKFPDVLTQTSGGSTIVPFTKVHIVIKHSDGSIALEQDVEFPAGQDQITVNLTVSLLAGAPASGEAMTLNLDYVNAAGEVVFKGSAPVTVTPTTPGAPAPPPVTVPVAFTGPGSTAAKVVISPRTVTVNAGDPFSFTAQAFDANNNLVANAPIVWTSLDPGLATLTSNTSGSGRAGNSGGTARITAALISGQQDQVTVVIRPRADQMSIVGGDGQSALPGAQLSQPVTVRIASSDGAGISGQLVSFSPNNGGSVGNTNVVTGTNGEASTTWRLGPGTGTQTLSATAAGGLAVQFSATARNATATRLVVSSGPPATLPLNGTFGVSVIAADADGNVVPTFVGTASIGLTGGAAGAALGGTTTATFVNGVAVFTGLSVNKIGTGYVVSAASSPSLGTVSTSAFNVTSGKATKLVFSTAPAAAIPAAQSFAVAVTAVDDAGNVDPTFVQPVALVLFGPAGSTLTGTATVTAVNGVANFPGLSIAKVGKGYTLTATSAPLTAATTGAFEMTGDKAIALKFASIPSPVDAGTSFDLVVTAVDRNGSVDPAFVGGITINMISSGANPAVLTGPRSATAVAGAATFSNLTIDKAGVFGLTATTTDLTAASGTITVTAGVAKTLRIASGDAQNGVAGDVLPVQVVVEAVDANGNGREKVPVAVTVQTGGGSLVDNPTLTDANGQAKITWKLGTTPGNQQLKVVSPGLDGSPLTINATATSTAKNLLLFSGGGQTGAPSTTLSAPIVFQVTDVNNFPKSGVPITITVGSGGVASPASGVTDANGKFTVTWTLGSGAGAQTLTATSTGLTGSPLSVSATAVVANVKTWTGAVNTAWLNAANWSPASVPVAGDSVIIPNTPTQPVITSATSIGSLVVASGVTLNVSGTTLTLSRSLASSGIISATGNVIMTGSGTVSGTLGIPLTITGTYTTAGNLAVNGSNALAVTGGLTVLAHAVAAGGTFATTGTGTLTMQTAGGSLTVNGAALFAGGDETGLISNGSITFNGDVAQTTTTTAFRTGGLNIVNFAGTANQTVTFTHPATSTFGNVSVFKTSGSINVGSGVLMKSLSLTSGTITGTSLTISGGTLNDQVGGVQVSSLSLDGIATALSSNTTTLNVGQVTFNNNPSNLQADLVVNGHVVVLGNLNVNSHKLTITGTFNTAVAGQLSMLSTSDSVTVNGTATFAGGSTAGTLTAGKLVLKGNFVQSTTSQAFKATSAHSTIFAGTTNQSISFAHPDTSVSVTCASSCFGNFQVDKSAGGGSITLNSDVKAASVNFSGDLLSGATRTLLSGSTNSLGVVGQTISLRRFVFQNAGLSRSPLFNVDTLVYFGTGSVIASESRTTVVRGTFTLPAVVNATVFVDSGGTLTATSGINTINGALITRGTGVFAQALTTADTVNVTGNATFSGGTSAPSGGVLRIGGNFTQSGTTTAFQGGSSHTTRFTGTPTISFANATNSYFGRLVFSGSSTATVSSDLKAQADVVVSAAGGTSMIVNGGLNIATIGGALRDSTYLVNARWRFAQTQFTGAPAYLPNVIGGDVWFLGNASLSDSLRVTGGVRITGASAKLTIGTYTLRTDTIGGSLVTTAGGKLNMTSAGGKVRTGDATFDGGSTAGELTAGTLYVYGSFTQGTNAQSYSATAPHNTWFSKRNQVRTVSFANPGYASLSHFGDWYNADTLPITLSTDVYADGQLQTGITTYHEYTSTNKLITAKGMDARDTKFTNTRLLIVEGGTIGVTDNIVFQSMNTSAIQFELQRTGASQPANDFLNFTFSTVPSSGRYMKVTDTDGAGTNGAFTINMNNPNPAQHGGFLDVNNGAVVNNWPNIITATAILSGNWGNTSTWDTGVVPTSTTNVIIPSSKTVTLTGNHAANNVTVNGGGTLAAGAYTLTINGNASNNGTVTCSTGDEIVLAGSSTYVDGVWCGAQITGFILGNGYTSFTQKLTINDGTFYVNGNYVTMGGLATQGTGAGGLLKMVNGADSVVVNGNATFGGVRDATGYQSEGRLVVNGNFSSTDKVFAASNNHRTIFNGSSAQSISWGTVTPGVGFNQVLFRNTGAKSIVTGIYLNSTVYLSSTLTSGITGGTTYLGGTIADSTSVSGGGWQITDTYFNGTPITLPAYMTSYVHLQGSGTTSLANNVAITGHLEVGGSAELEINGHYVNVSGNFVTSSSGKLKMASSADSVVVSSATWNGGSETGKLTAGTLNVKGTSFAVNTSANKFDASGTHTTEFSGSSGTTISWTPPSSTVGFKNLRISGTGTMSLGSNIAVNGLATITSSATNGISGSYTAYLNGAGITDGSTILGGGWKVSLNEFTAAGASVTNIPGTLTNTDTIKFTGGGTVSLPNNVISNYVVVDNTNLKLNGKFLKVNNGNTFTTQNGGTLEMTNASGDSLEVGWAYFNGGSTATKLTEGGITINGISAAGGLYQGYDAGFSVVSGASASAFSPTGTRVWFSSGNTVHLAFKDPGSGSSLSHFHFVQSKMSSAVGLKTDVFVDSLLLGEQSGANFNSDNAGTTVRTITTKGIYNSGTFGLTLNGVNIVLNDGTASSTFFNSVTWTGFPSSYTGYLFEQNRSSAGPTLNFQTYSAVSFGGAGAFIKNSGTTNLLVGGTNTGGTGTCNNSTYSVGLTTGVSCK